MVTEKNLTYNIKDLNKKNIINYLRENSNATKQDIVMALQLSLPTVTQNLTYLEDEGVVVRAGKIGKTGGRNAVAFSLNIDAKIAIGVDITKHHITCVAVGLDGEAIDFIRKRIDFAKNDDYYKLLGELVQELIKKCEIRDTGKILGVGIGVPALVTPDGMRITYGKILSFTDERCENIARYIPYDSRMFNDANAAAYAEMWSNKDMQNAFYICLGNDIGGAVILDNKTYIGNNQRSGEIGHMTLVNDGRPCFCGQFGCFETYCSATVLSDMTDGSLDEFFLRMNDGDVNLAMEFQRYLQYLAIAINNVRMLFDCNIIIGGYIGAYIDAYMGELNRLVKKRNMFGDDLENCLIPCKYKVEAIAAGAALPYVEDFFEGL